MSEAVKKVREKHLRYAIVTGAGNVMVKFEDILYVEGQKRKVTYHLQNNNRASYDCNESLGDVEARLGTQGLFANVPGDPGQHAAYLLSQPNPSDFDRWHGPPRSANRTATKLCRHTTYGWALYDRTNILTDRGFDWTYFLPAVVYRVVPTDLRKAAVGVGIPGNIGRRLSHHRGARYQGNSRSRRFC